MIEGERVLTDFIGGGKWACSDLWVVNVAAIATFQHGVGQLNVDTEQVISYLRGALSIKPKVKLVKWNWLLYFHTYLVNFICLYYIVGVHEH